jgi:hypothetical protein
LIVGRWEKTSEKGATVTFTRGGAMSFTKTLRFGRPPGTPGYSTNVSTSCKYKVTDNTLETTESQTYPTRRDTVYQVNVNFLSWDELVITDIGKGSIYQLCGPYKRVR